jgi:GT2 family glycosyltransferase
MRPVTAIDLIIVNWNAGSQLSKCLASIVDADKVGLELARVVVVDNASTDGSLSGIENFNLPLQVIRNSKNLGFAAACNLGATGCRTDYLLFLNPDAMLFRDSLSQPVAFLEEPENASVGILGIQLVDEDGTVARHCSRFPTPTSLLGTMVGLDRILPRRFPRHFMTDWDHLDSRDVDQIIGAFFLVRRSLFEVLTGFDERFFVYFEELDLSKRAHEMGWRSHYLADVCAYHKGGGTSGQVKADRLLFNLRSRILYSFKHFGIFAAVVVTAGTLVVEPLSRILYGMLRVSVSEVLETLLGYARLWWNFPSIIMTALSSRERS